MPYGEKIGENIYENAVAGFQTKAQAPASGYIVTLGTYFNEHVFASFLS